MDPTNNVNIRCFDLGGGGLKTALVTYNTKSNSMTIVGKVEKLGKCPDDKKVSDWVRMKMNEITQEDLSKEVNHGHLFGFSLAGIDKLKTHVETSDIPVLFNLPREKVASTDDGAAHLIATLKTVENLPPGRIWNIAIGTGVGFGFTNSKKEVKPAEDFLDFFGQPAWEVREPHSNKGIWEAGSGPGFDRIVEKNDNQTDEKAFAEFATRYKRFIEEKIIDQSKIPGKEYGAPAAVVFTGGHTEWHPNRLVKTLNDKNLKVPAFQGPKEAGILGAAWLAVDTIYQKQK